MLEDLIAAAFNDAVRHGAEVSQERMAGFTAGLNLPPASRCRSERRRKPKASLQRIRRRHSPNIVSGGVAARQSSY